MAARPAAVIFDMDGLLFDSERLARDAFVQACEQWGLQADMTAYMRCIGSTYEATQRILLEAYGPEFPYADIERTWSGIYHARIHACPVPLKEGAVALLDHLRGAEIPTALATSTRRSTAVVKLEKAGLAGYFSHTICGGETPRGKPHPDPYMAAAAGLRLAPEQCWALEDSENGVRSALAAGCLVIQVPDLVIPGAEMRALGHVIESSLLDVLAWLEEK
ncbi:MAG: HAD family phosphatase [Pseudomonadales bacterium]